MKRPGSTIAALLLFLLSGLVVNIAFAVALAHSACRPVWGIPMEDTRSPAHWPSSVPPHWPATPADATLQRLNAGCQRLMIERTFTDQSGFHNIFGRAHVMAGWPLAALERLENWEHREHISAYPVGWPYDYRPVSGAFRGGLVIGDYRFPIRPLFPGFLINTLFYSAATATLWYTPGLIRSARSRRNACLNCGYARTGLAADTPCPECGGAPAS